MLVFLGVTHSHHHHHHLSLPLICPSSSRSVCLISYLRVTESNKDAPKKAFFLDKKTKKFGIFFCSWQNTTSSKNYHHDIPLACLGSLIRKQQVKHLPAAAAIASPSFAPCLHQPYTIHLLSSLLAQVVRIAAKPIQSS
jgi:hypothetical protein